MGPRLDYEETQRSRPAARWRVPDPPAGRGKRLADGTPDHDCDERCRPHQCRPAEPATVAQIHAIIKGFLGYAVRWKWISENPAAHASPPEVTAEHDDPPSPDDAVRLLAAAEDHSRVMAVVVWLALVTGARRGELCALRWPDLNGDEGDLLIGGSYAVRKGRQEVTAGGEFDEDGFTFCAAAGRLGHSGGGPVTLRVYAHRTRPADQRAAELLAEQPRGLKAGSAKGGRR